MARLKNTQFATFDAGTWGNRHTVTIGHNRTLAREVSKVDGSIELVFRLHGHPIARKTLAQDGNVYLTLDHCGYRTVTTREAMKDAIGLFGYWGNVSFAKGEFTYGVEASYRGKPLVWHKADMRRAILNMGPARPVDLN